MKVNTTGLNTRTSQVLYAVSRNSKVSIGARWVWAYCYLYRKAEGVYPDYDRIAKAGHLTESSVSQCFGELAGANLISGARAHYHLEEENALGTSLLKRVLSGSKGTSAVLTLLSEIKRRNAKLARPALKLESTAYVQLRRLFKTRSLEELIDLLGACYKDRGAKLGALSVTAFVEYVNKAAK